MFAFYLVLNLEPVGHWVSWSFFHRSLSIFSKRIRLCSQFSRFGIKRSISDENKKEFSGYSRSCMKKIQKSWRLYGGPAKNLTSFWFRFPLVLFRWIKDSLLKVSRKKVESYHIWYWSSLLRASLLCYGGKLRRRDRAREASYRSYRRFGSAVQPRFFVNAWRTRVTRTWR